MFKEDYTVFLELVNASSFKGDKAEYVAELKKRIIEEIKETKEGSEEDGLHA